MIKNLVPKELPQKIAVYRAINRITQEQFAKKCGLSQKLISFIESSTRKSATTKTIDAIYKVLDQDNSTKGAVK